MKGYPGWFGNTVITLMLVLIGSGLLLIPTTLELRLEWALSWRLSGSHRLLVVALHSLVAFAVFGLVGAIWSIHMRLGWRRRQQRISGLILALMMSALVLTGIGIFYFGDENWQLTASVAHLLIGIGLAVIFLWHFVRGRRNRLDHHHGPRF